MFYNQDTGNPRFDMSRNLAGRVRFNPANPDFPNLTWQNALSSLTSSVAQVPTPYAFANKYERRTPYSLQYLLNVQRELSRDVVLEAGYLGSVSHHLEMLRAANESLPGTVGSVVSRAPYPTFGRIQLVDNGANANYNAVSAKVTKRYSQGLTLLASYTYAKSLDVSSGIRVQGDDTLFPANSYCVRCEYGLSAFDTRQRFVATGLWDLPVGKGKQVNISNKVANAVVGDWQVGSIVTLQSGFPITPNIGGTDRSGTGGGFDRPNATGVSPYLDNPTPSKWFNLAAFTVPTPGTYGNVGPEFGGRTGRGGVRFLPPQGLQDDGKAAAGIPLGVVQRRQPPGVGHAQHQRQQRRFVRHHHRYPPEHAADAVGAEVRVLAGNPVGQAIVFGGLSISTGWETRRISLIPRCPWWAGFSLSIRAHRLSGPTHSP